MFGFPDRPQSDFHVLSSVLEMFFVNSKCFSGTEEMPLANESPLVHLVRRCLTHTLDQYSHYLVQKHTSVKCHLHV